MLKLFPLQVICGRWEICSEVLNLEKGKHGKKEESCVEMDSNCPCTHEGATALEETSISKVKLLDKRQCYIEEQEL